MIETSYVDEDGRHHAVQLPEGTPEKDASLGLPLGPPNLRSLGLPMDVEVRLHNQLFSRRLFMMKDVRARRMDVFGALMGAFKVDISAIVQLYLQEEVPKSARKPGFRKLKPRTKKPAKR